MDACRDWRPSYVDCATSIVQRGKIEYYARIGKDTPAGQVIGRNGEALTDSVEILDDLNTGKAALAPLGGIGEDLAGYKGYGYATVVEILSAALQQGNFLRALSGIGPNRKKSPSIWVISLSLSIPRPLWVWKPSKRPLETS